MSIGLEAWRQGGRLVERQGCRVFLREGGDPSAPALVLIHGFPTASWDWAPLWSDLAARFRLVTLDMIGFGFSDKPTDFPYSIRAQADLFEQVLRGLDVAEAHLVAHDYGDTVAQELLARHNEGQLGFRILSVVLLNGGLFPETHRPVLIQKLLMSPLGPLVARLTSKASVAASLRKIFGPRTPPGPEEIDGFWTLMTHNDGIARMPKLIRYMQERRDNRQRWVGALTGTRVPLRLINGLLDPISGAHMVARYRALVPSPDVVELPEIGHYPQIEDPAGVLTGVRAFHTRLGVG